MIKLGTLFLFLISIQSSTLKQTPTMSVTNKQAIEKLLFQYRDALNASSVPSVLSLYDQDGVFMPTNAPTATGTEQLKAAYEHVFGAIQLKFEFYVDEITISGDYAFATTRSKGSTLIHATGQNVPEENRELFVFKNSNGNWKISRYMFNKTK